MLEPSKNGLAWIDDLTGGLNDSDPPEQIADHQLQTAENIEWYQTRLAQRRQGGTNNIGTEPWAAAASLIALGRFPTNDETAAQLFGIANTSPNTMGRVAASANFTAVTVSDAIDTTNDGRYAEFAAFNRKLFVAYDSAQDRLHVWDGTSLRRVGLPKSGTPTVANTGAGAYPAIQRWYKTQFAFNHVSGDSTQIVLSELSDAVAFTPSGAGTAARITRPTLPGEGETAWTIYGSPDNVNFYPIISIAVGTTTYDDSASPATYATTIPTNVAKLDASVQTGDYFTTPPSPKFLLVHNARLLQISSWEQTNFRSRVWFSPILHSSAYTVADDERLPSTNYIDLDPTDGGQITGAAMLNELPYLFKLARIYQLNSTTNANKPYTRTVISRTVGAISHRSIFVGEDDEGNQCLYFLGRRGAYRYGPYGLEYLGMDIEKGTWATVNIASTTPPFGLYYEKKQQVWWWVTTGASSTPNLVLVLNLPFAKRQENNTTRGGWVTYTGDLAKAYCAVLFAKTLGATMSLDLKPYVGQIYQSGDPDGPCVMYDADGVYTDAAARLAAYTGSFKTKAFPPGGRDKRGGLLEGFITAKATGAAFNVSAIRNYGQETIPAAVVINGTDTATRDDQKIENLTVGDCKTVEIAVDDGGQSLAWTIDSLGLRVKEEGAR